MGSSFVLAARLAFRQMLYEKTKTISALLGVVFACVLVFMQAGFKESLFESATRIPRKLNGDLFLYHPQTEAYWKAVDFPKTELMRAWGHPDVVAVHPFYTSMGLWRNPVTFTKRAAFVIGCDPEAIQSSELQQYAHLFSIKDGIFYDTKSKEKFFGPISELMKKGTVEIELNDKKFRILGTYSIGSSFAASGSVVMSVDNFLSLYPRRARGNISLGMICLKDGADPIAVKNDLRSGLTDMVSVATKEEFIQFEENHWRTVSPIGFIFGTGIIMGLIVGAVIVYQILFSDVTTHLKEYATLKAMGYMPKHLSYIVISESMILACLGFPVGLIASIGLYQVCESVTAIMMRMTLLRIISVFLAILAMCALSGILALKKLRDADPADMF